MDMRMCACGGQGAGGRVGRQTESDVRKIFTEELTASASGGGTSGASTCASIL